MKNNKIYSFLVARSFRYSTFFTGVALFFFNALYAQPCSDIFISEILLGIDVTTIQSDNINPINHSIELYNPTERNIDLSSYEIVLTNIEYSNIYISLEGILNARSTFVLSHSQSIEPILSLSNKTSTQLCFDDMTVVRLIKNDTIILDKIGNEGPAIHLSEVDLDSLKYPNYVASININLGSLKSLDLRRDALIREGSSNFDIAEIYSEWAPYIGLEFNNLGIHECACAQPVLFFYNADLLYPEARYQEGSQGHRCVVRITEPLPRDITITINVSWHKFPTPNVPAITTNQGVDVFWEETTFDDLTWITSTSYSEYEIIREVVLDPLEEFEEGGGVSLVILDDNDTGTTVSTTKNFFDFIIEDPLTPIDNILLLDFKIFPTLVTQQTSKINWKADDSLKIEYVHIFHQSGKVIMEASCVQCTSIDLPQNLKDKGLYYVKFTTSDGSFIRRFIKI